MNLSFFGSLISAAGLAFTPAEDHWGIFSNLRRGFSLQPQPPGNNNDDHLGYGEGFMSSFPARECKCG